MVNYSTEFNTQFLCQLCELQIQVLERSKVIAQLQARLTELIINCPESASALQDLKRTMESINFRRLVQYLAE